jgi:hypothetical protein
VFSNKLKLDIINTGANTENRECITNKPTMEIKMKP